MIVYGVVIAITLALYLWFRYGMHFEKEYVDRATVMFFFIAYLLLLCLRDVSIGTDTKVYVYRFQQLQVMSWGDALSYSGKGDEFAFILLNKLVGMIGGPRLLIIVVSLIVVIPVMRFYRDESEGAIFTISFFLISLLFGMFFSGMRQSIAIAMAVPAYYYSKQKKIIPFILTTILAFLFHRTGIVIGALYPIYHAKITRKWLWFVVPIMAVIYFYRDIIFEFLFALSGENYVRGYSYLTGTSTQGALMVLFILLSIYCYVVLDEDQAGEEEIGLRNILLLAACIHLFTPVNSIVARINMYFILFIPVAVTRINNRCKENYYTITQIATFVMSAYFIIHFLTSSGSTTQFENYKLFF
jgi:hypothetical protein